MPHRIIRAKGHERRRSLGWLATAWMEYFIVHGPGDVQGQPVKHGDEYTGFIVDCYALKANGRRIYDSAFLSRPKGCDKSGLAARFGLFEALGPCRFWKWAKGGEVYRDPWGLGFVYVYERGEPMGRPVQSPYIRILATEEGQTGNVYNTIHFNLTGNDDSDPLLSQIPGLDPGLTRVLLPGRGEITPSTAGSSSKDGGIETFADFDESHLYNLPGLRGMYATVVRNLDKRKKVAETWYLETTTMFAAGEDSIAEETYKLSELVEQGKTKSDRSLFDHRWGECEDLSDEAALRAAIADAYGDALEWNDLDGKVAGFHDPRKSTVDNRRFTLNAPSSVADAYVREYEWTARYAPDAIVADRDVITMGFDGSRKRTEGVTDATALIGCRLSDGYLFELGVWEQPDGKDGETWRVPVAEVDAAVRSAFKRYTVVAFYADPAKWESWIARWEAEFGPKLKVKASAKHPIEWWVVGGRISFIVGAVKAFLDAIIDGEITHSGEYKLTQHVLNARRRQGKQGITIAKEHPESPRKIDACFAAILAWTAALDATAAGATKRRGPRSAPKRIR